MTVAMDVGGFDYNETVNSQNVKVEAIRSEMQSINLKLDTTFLAVNTSIANTSGDVRRLLDELRMAKGRIDMWKSVDIGPSIAELQRRMINFDRIQSAVNEAVKFEFSRANTLTEEIVKHVKELTAPGGDLQKQVEHMISLGLANSDVRINNGMNEIANVKAKVIAIENVIASQGSPVSGFSRVSHKGNVWLEYHVINSLQVMSSDQDVRKWWVLYLG